MVPALTRRELFKYLYNRHWKTDQRPLKQKRSQQISDRQPSKAKSVKNEQCFSISEILEMPDENLRIIQPVLNKNAKVSEHLCDALSESMQTYFTEDKIVNMFNGEHTLEELACQLKDEKDSISIEEAYLAVKRLFVRLCEERKVGFHRKVCSSNSI
ncbi:hypothetical protein QUF90_16030 [Desulfococcaceae bacterium HSG9]|nr:hypothetical protein [Desulfococcaceae bacterium HSG9]